MPIAEVESLDHDGRGVAHVDGKAIFIEGALPGELVEYASYRRKPKYENASTVASLRASSQRVVPRCRHFGTLWRLFDAASWIRPDKRPPSRVLEDALWHIARIAPTRYFRPFPDSLGVSAARPIVGAHGSPQRRCLWSASAKGTAALWRRWTPARSCQKRFRPDSGAEVADWRDVPSRIDCRRSRLQLVVRARCSCCGIWKR
jgi:predicted RNA-binding protein with TRAM domain